MRVELLRVRTMQPTFATFITIIIQLPVYVLLFWLGNCLGSERQENEGESMYHMPEA